MAADENGARERPEEEADVGTEVDLHTLARSQRRIEASLAELVVGQEKIATAISKARQELRLLSGGGLSTTDASRHEHPDSPLPRRNTSGHSLHSSDLAAEASGKGRRRRTTFAPGTHGGSEVEDMAQVHAAAARALSSFSMGPHSEASRRSTMRVSLGAPLHGGQHGGHGPEPPHGPSEARRSLARHSLHSNLAHGSHMPHSWTEARRSIVSSRGASSHGLHGHEAPGMHHGAHGAGWRQSQASLRTVESSSSRMTAQQEAAFSMTIRHLDAERFDDGEERPQLYNRLCRSFSLDSDLSQQGGLMGRTFSTGNDLGENGFIASLLPLHWPSVLEARTDFNDNETQDSRMARVGKSATGYKGDKDSPASRLLMGTLQSDGTQPNKRRCNVLIDPSSARSAVWQLCSVVLLVYDLTVIPYVLAWDVSFKGFLEIMLWISCVFWLIDIPLNFVTCYYTKGELQTNVRKIALRYCRSWFFIDILLVMTDWSSLVLSMTDDIGEFKLMRLAKAGRLIRIFGVLRLLRFMRVIEDRIHMSIGETQRLGLTVGAISLGVLWFNHVMSCVWYVIGTWAPTDTDRRWVQHHIAVDPSTGATLPYLESSPLYQYLTAFHWSVAQMTLGAIEVQSTNAVERLFSIICLTFGLLFGSTLISTLSAAMVDFRETRRERNEKLRDLRRYLRENKVTKRLAIVVQQQAGERMGRRAKLHDTDVKALPLLSAVIRSQLRYDIFGPIISKMPLLRLFASLDEDIAQQLCMRGVDMLFLRPKDYLFAAGNLAEGVFYLSDGTLSYNQDPDSAPVVEVVSRTVYRGSWLAEAAFWSEWIHVGTAEADSECQAIAIGIETFTELVGRHLVIRQICKEYCEQFHKRITQASPPHSVWPDDLEVPASDYPDLVVAMGKEVQVIIGLDAVKRLNKTTRTRHGDLREEVRQGKSVVVVSGDGEVQRIVAVIVLKVQNEDGHILVLLGSRQGESLKARPELPGTKRRREEDVQACVQRLLRSRLRTLAHCVGDIEGTTREVKEKVKKGGEESSHHIPTKYVRTVCSMRLISSPGMRAVSSRLTYQRSCAGNVTKQSTRGSTTRDLMRERIPGWRTTTRDLMRDRLPGWSSESEQDAVAKKRSSKSFVGEELGRLQAAYNILAINLEDDHSDYYVWVSPPDLELLLGNHGEALALPWLMDMVEEGFDSRLSVREAIAQVAEEGESSDGGEGFRGSDQEGLGILEEGDEDLEAVEHDAPPEQHDDPPEQHHDTPEQHGHDGSSDQGGRVRQSIDLVIASI